MTFYLDERIWKVCQIKKMELKNIQSKWGDRDSKVVKSNFLKISFSIKCPKKLSDLIKKMERTEEHSEKPQADEIRNKSRLK